MSRTETKTWSYQAGSKPHTVTAFERTDRESEVWIRWGGTASTAPKKRPTGRVVRDDRGRLVARLVKEVEELARKAAENVQAGRDPFQDAPPPPDALTLRRGFTLLFTVGDGKFASPEGRQYKELKQLADDVVDLLGPDARFDQLVPHDAAVLWRKIANARKQGRVRPSGKPFGGCRMAERAVGILFEASRWLADCRKLPAAATLPRNWRAQLRKEWTEITGQAVRQTEEQPCHSREELLRLLANLDKADPRLHVGLEFFAEARLGQGARTRRSHLDLTPGKGGFGLGQLTAPDCGKKLGVVIDLTQDQRALLDRALRDGYLHELEAAYQRGEIPDYPLLPQGRLVGGVIALRQGPPRVRPTQVPRPIRPRSLKPITPDGLRNLFRELEALAGVPSKPGRGWLGVRRGTSDFAEDLQSDERALNALSGHRDSRMRQGRYQGRHDPVVLKKAAETRDALRRLARANASETGANPTLEGPKSVQPTPQPTPTGFPLGKVENETPVEPNDPTGVKEAAV